MPVFCLRFEMKYYLTEPDSLCCIALGNPAFCAGNRLVIIYRTYVGMESIGMNVKSTFICHLLTSEDSSFPSKVLKEAIDSVDFFGRKLRFPAPGFLHCLIVVMSVIKGLIILSNDGLSCFF
jgi:hypothetical protein